MATLQVTIRCCLSFQFAPLRSYVLPTFISLFRNISELYFPEDRFESLSLEVYAVAFSSISGLLLLPFYRQHPRFFSSHHRRLSHSHSTSIHDLPLAAVPITLHAVTHILHKRNQLSTMSTIIYLRIINVRYLCQALYFKSCSKKNDVAPEYQTILLMILEMWRLTYSSVIAVIIQILSELFSKLSIAIITTYYMYDSTIMPMIAISSQSCGQGCGYRYETDDRSNLG